MIKAGLILVASLFLCISSSNTMARSPLPNMTGTKTISPVCVVSGLPENAIQDLQRNLCEEAARQLIGRASPVEILALNDPRISSPGRLVLGLRAHVETVEGLGPILTISGQISGDQRRVPTAAHSAFFNPTNPTVTPAVRECMRKVLQEQGLL